MRYTIKFSLKWFGDMPLRSIDFQFIDDQGYTIMYSTLGTTLLYMGEYGAYHMNLLWNPSDIELPNRTVPDIEILPYIRIELL